MLTVEPESQADQDGLSTILSSIGRDVSYRRGQCLAHPIVPSTRRVLPHLICRTEEQVIRREARLRRTYWQTDSDRSIPHAPGPVLFVFTPCRVGRTASPAFQFSLICIARAFFQCRYMKTELATELPTWSLLRVRLGTSHAGDDGSTYMSRAGKRAVAPSG